MHRRNFLKTSLSAAAAVSGLNLARVTSAWPLLNTAPRSQRVIIIGAGLAGMSAAYELIQLGHNVSIFEARMRAGGRVQTLREPFSDGMYAEGGAMYVPDSHDLTMKYVKLLKVELEAVPHSDLGSRFRLRDHQLDLMPNVPVKWPFNLHKDERNLDRRGLWERYVIPVLPELDGDNAADWPPAALEKYDRISFGELLKQRGASPDAIAIMNLGLASGLGNGADTVSALDLLREAAHRERTKQAYLIKGGSDRFPLAFATRLADKIQYGAQVTAISQMSDQVRVTYLQGGRQQTATSDRVVCAVPFSVLRTISVTPAFSPAKQEVIQQLQYTSVARVYLQSRKRFWLDEKQSGQAATDLPIMSVYQRTPNIPGLRGILESYTTGPSARQITAMPERERIAFVLRYMNLVHPAMAKNFEGGASKCWDEDPWARGAYAWFKPGEMIQQLRHISTPEGRVHFAGEHASAYPGWMQGALESGNRVAREVNDASV